MTRVQIMVLSAVCCLFGLGAIFGSGSLRGASYAVNFVLAVVLAIVAGRDLDRRGVRFGWLVGVSYVLAPLIGFVLYAIFSSRPARVSPAPS